MATIDLQGTEFTFSVLPLKLFSRRHFVKAAISVRNEFIQYSEINKNISRDDLEEWIFCMCRLLAGAYKKEYSLSFVRAGLAIDFYPYTNNGKEATRQERRENDCVMLVRLLMRSTKNKQFLGGVNSFIFHRKDVEKFAADLRKEFDAIYAQLVPGSGEFMFVGVSPLGYQGCNYWYYSPEGNVEKGEYVWVTMGRHNLEQIVYVDSVRYFDKDGAPYDPERVKQILRKATPSETENILREQSKK